MRKTLLGLVTLLIMAMIAQSAVAQDAVGKHIVVYAYLSTAEATVDSGDLKPRVVKYDSLAKFIDEYTAKGYQLIQSSSLSLNTGAKNVSEIPMLILIFEKK